MRYLGATVTTSFLVWISLASWAEARAREDRPEALRVALALESHLGAGANAAHWERLAASADDAIEAAGAALRANPRFSNAWIALGLAQERSGRWAEAEHSLLEAARVDRQHLPAWTLANFYFRRGAEEAFWEWAKKASALTYDDYRTLLRLCDQLDRHPERVLDRLGSCAPCRAYLDLLIGENRLEDAMGVARRMVEAADRPRLADLVSRQILARRQADALEIWNRIAPPLNPQHGPVLGNLAFREPPTGAGFDWTLKESPGIRSRWTPGEIHFTFSGRQPDHAILIEQTFPVARGKRYRLTANSPLPSVSWRIDGRDTGHVAPADGLATLQLVYQRQPGTIPYQGEVRIGKIRLDVEPRSAR